MASKTTYGAFLFRQSTGRRQSPRIEERRFRNAEEARARAERVVTDRVCVGAVAFSRSADPEMGDYDEPVVLGEFGEVPNGDLGA